MFRNRKEAGERLAVILESHRTDEPVVLALSRGGVAVASEVAHALQAPLDLFLVRRLMMPGCHRVVLGAIAEGGEAFVEPAVRELGMSSDQLAAIAELEAVEMHRQVRRFRGDRPLPDLTGRTVIMVDDGVATGCSARAAARAVRRQRPRWLAFAVPVIHSRTVALVRGDVDELVYLEAPTELIAVGYWYAQFGPVPDEEVVSLLDHARHSEAVLGAANDEAPDRAASHPS